MISVIEPSKVRVASPVPSPTRKLRPVVPPRVMRPLLAVSVTRSVPEPASTSLMLIKLPLPLLNTRLAS
ncbi:hypothetical protein D3C85_865850 [compost metagenome]